MRPWSDRRIMSGSEEGAARDAAADLKAEDPNAADPEKRDPKATLAEGLLNPEKKEAEAEEMISSSRVKPLAPVSISALPAMRTGK